MVSVKEQAPGASTAADNGAEVTVPLTLKSILIKAFALKKTNPFF